MPQARFGALADRWKVGTRASVGSGLLASVGCVAKLDFLLDPLSCAPLAPPSVSRARNAAKNKKTGLKRGQSFYIWQGYQQRVLVYIASSH